jgi:hypothetical protein
VKFDVLLKATEEGIKVHTVPLVIVLKLPKQTVATPMQSSTNCSCLV